MVPVFKRGDTPDEEEVPGVVLTDTPDVEVVPGVVRADTPDVGGVPEVVRADTPDVGGVSMVELASRYVGDVERGRTFEGGRSFSRVSPTS